MSVEIRIIRLPAVVNRANFLRFLMNSFEGFLVFFVSSVFYPGATPSVWRENEIIFEPKEFAKSSEQEGGTFDLPYVMIEYYTRGGFRRFSINVRGHTKVCSSSFFSISS